MIARLGVMIKYYSMLNRELHMKSLNDVKIITPFYFNCVSLIPEILNPDDFQIYTKKEDLPNSLEAADTVKKEHIQITDTNAPPETVKKEHICKIIDTNVQEISADKKGIFIFLTDSTRSKSQTILNYREYIFDDSIVSLIIDKTHLKLLFRDSDIFNNKEEIHLEIHMYQGIISSLIQIALLILFIVLITRFCYKAVKSVSNKDPMYEDFVVSSANIKKFREVNDKSMPTCLICFEEYTPEDDVRILDCEHFFHPDCVDRWLIGHSRCCPYCRKEIVVNERV